MNFGEFLYIQPDDIKKQVWNIENLEKTLIVVNKTCLKYKFMYRNMHQHISENRKRIKFYCLWLYVIKCFSVLQGPR